ncbi:hypothetical protein ACJA3S_20200 [Pseudomonas sp. KnCO4]|uniref:hypothetical protein n=1 Tax=Pseudomonas sp. KnCO4 TaxID=3381355 RepID=UPI003877B518
MLQFVGNLLLRIQCLSIGLDMLRFGLAQPGGQLTSNQMIDRRGWEKIGGWHDGDSWLEKPQDIMHSHGHGGIYRSAAGLGHLFGFPNENNPFIRKPGNFQLHRNVEEPPKPCNFAAL